MKAKPYGIICPITHACEVLEPRWTIPILSEMWSGSTRFNDIKRGVGNISPALLTKRLKELEQNGLIERIEDPATGQVDYLRTQRAIDLEPALSALGEWAQCNIEARQALEDTDVSNLMWHMRGLIHTDQLPNRQVVIQFRFGEAIGCILLYRREVSPFSDDHIALVETFAAQAVIAIENVRQFRELQDRLERESATREILHVIAQSRDNDRPVFESILRQAARLCDAPRAGLHLLTEGGRNCRKVAGWGAIGDATGKENAVFPEGTEWDLDGVAQAAKTVMEARTLLTDDIRKDPCYADGHPRYLKMADEDGIIPLMTVPLIKDGKGVGCIILNRLEPRPFDPKDVRLVETFAAQATIAIDNVRQFKALEKLNAELGDRVQSQVGELERMGRLKRFLPSAVADAVVSAGDKSMLSSHRALVATLFCDMRGFTAFCESAEPEETIEVLQTYHQEMSDLIDQHGGGVDQRAGDGIMVIFNDPIPADDPAGDAVRLALAVRKKMRELCAKWKKLGHRLGFGVGISFGYATVGIVGSAGRYD